MAKYTYNVGPAALLGWTQTFDMGKASPAISNRVFKLLSDAEGYVADEAGTACQGLVLSIVGETGDRKGKNGIYQIQFAEGRTDTQPGIRKGRYRLVRVDAAAAAITITNGDGINVSGDGKNFVISAAVKKNGGIDAVGGLHVVQGDNITVDARGVSVNTATLATGLAGNGLDGNGSKLAIKPVPNDGTLSVDSTGVKVVSTKVVENGLTVNGGITKSGSQISVTAGNGIAVAGGTTGAVSATPNTAQGINVTAQGIGITLDTSKDTTAKNILKQSTNGLYANLHLVEEAGGESTNIAKTIKLVDDEDIQYGAAITIDKDNSLIDVKLVSKEDMKGVTAKPPTNEKGPWLYFHYMTVAAEDKHVFIDVASFLQEAEFKNGLQVNDDGTVQARLGKGLAFDKTATDGSQGIEVYTDGKQGIGVGSQGVYFKAGKGLDVDLSTGEVTVNANNSGAITGAGSGLKPEGVNKLAVNPRTLSATNKKSFIDIDGKPTYDAEVPSFDVNGDEGVETCSELISVGGKIVGPGAGKGGSEERMFYVTEPLGGFAIGEQILRGDSLFAVLKKLLNKTYSPTYTSPTPTITVSGSSLGKTYERNSEVEAVTVTWSYEPSTEQGGKYDKITGWATEYPADTKLAKCELNAVTPTQLTTGLSTTQKTTTIAKHKIQDKEEYGCLVSWKQSTVTPVDSDGHECPSKKIPAGSASLYKAIHVDFAWWIGMTEYDGVGKNDPNKQGAVVTDAKLNSWVKSGNLRQKWFSSDTNGGELTSSKDSTKRTYMIILPEGCYVADSRNSFNTDNLADWTKQTTPFMRVVNGVEICKYYAWTSYLSDAGVATLYKGIKVGGEPVKPKQPTQQTQN